MARFCVYKNQVHPSCVKMNRSHLKPILDRYFLQAKGLSVIMSQKVIRENDETKVTKNFDSEFLAYRLQRTFI